MPLLEEGPDSGSPQPSTSKGIKRKRSTRIQARDKEREEDEKGFYNDEDNI